MGLVSSIKNLVVPRGRREYLMLFGPVRGCRVRLNLQKQMKTYLGLYEIELNKYFRQLIDVGDLCFDVGGQDGYDALMLSKLSKSKVVSFECLEDCVAEMKETLLANPSHDIEIVNKFVSNKSDGENTTLDEIAKERFYPDFIKMDIEGAEVPALQGCKEIFEKSKPKMIIEVHGIDAEEFCVSYLQKWGYRLTLVDQRSWLKEYRPMEHNRWLICE